eukprot:CAMPEP_0176405312 /NCGR_PEP_ID=MMETSP0127-20121128/267_1 /TAXON_ID=938130 /ORGANISM="Platyophrya macrostoma, Strain WH" /LENGTH=366 /DNA_ID=CAMNT_0017784355 /DNA_START=22 /DNA_END=1122 /DNA_ORIENTATION=-
MKRLAFISLFLCLALSAEIDVFSTLIGQEYSALNNFPVTCDIIVKDGLCLYEGQKTLLSSPQPLGLAGHWTFDDSLGADSSGYGNNALTTIVSGPTIGPTGYSAATTGTTFVKIANGTALNNEAHSLTFWFFMRSETTQNSAGLRWCPILLRGENEASSNNRGLAIYFDRLNYNLRIFITSNITGEYFDSTATLPLSKWTHVAIVRSNKRTKLYLNGILDSSLSTSGVVEQSQAPLYLGNVPWREEECTLLSYFDELKIYWGALPVSAIQSEASLIGSNDDPNSIQLGCINCTSSEAQVSCLSNYHVCTTIELDAFAFQNAYTLGWVQWGTVIWSYETVTTAATATESGETSDESGTVGLGICCEN